MVATYWWWWQPRQYQPSWQWWLLWSSVPDGSAQQARELSWIWTISTLAPSTPLTWRGHSGRCSLGFRETLIKHQTPIPQMQLLARLPKRDSPGLATRQVRSKVNKTDMTWKVDQIAKPFTCDKCNTNCVTGSSDHLNCIDQIILPWKNPGERCDSLSEDRKTEPRDGSQQRSDPLPSCWTILPRLLLVRHLKTSLFFLLGPGLFSTLHLELPGVLLPEMELRGCSS